MDDREQKQLRQSTVSAFFRKVPRMSVEIDEVAVADSVAESETDEGTTSKITRDVPVPHSFHSQSTAAACDIENEHSDMATAPKPTATSNYDVGLYLNVSSEDNIDNSLKLKLITEPWHPEATFSFPAEGPRRLRFQMQWLNQNPWLVYSPHACGALCKYCCLFARDHEAGKGGHQGLGAFVVKPFVKWATAKESFKRHSDTEYHKTCVSLAEHFVSVMKDSCLNIVLNLDSSLRKQAEENRRRLVPFIETIIFCGRQEIALRGTDDAGPLEITEPKTNDGNFRALLRMRMKCGDATLKRHVETAPHNALYTSPKIQNEIIAVCGTAIQQAIAQKVNASECFAVLADETSDISRTEQCTICVRYVAEQTGEFVVREDFLEFVPVYDATGASLANIILQTLRKNGIDLRHLYGQGYDGAAAMSGEFRGVQAVIREEYPKALYVHCSAHTLNLALCHSCSVQSVRNCIGTVSSTITFFRSSVKRSECLKRIISEQSPSATSSSLIALCQTRWIEKHDALLRFVDLYTPIVTCLESLATDSNTETSSTASQLFHAVTQSEFVISVCVLKSLFSLTLPLSKNLQKVDCDLAEANSNVQHIVDIAKQRRSNDEEFSMIFVSAENMLHSVDSEITIPRVTKRAKNRANMEFSNPEEYFRRSVYIPVVDDFIQQLSDRFENHRSIISSLYKILPAHCVSAYYSDIEQCVQFYCQDGDMDSIKAEFNIWQIKCAKMPLSERPTSALLSLSLCNRDFFPTLHFLLKVLATLPVSTATAERTFSTLKRLKTYLRNATGQDRLTGLALMSVHRDIEIDTQHVITELARKPRRLNFVL
jgi:hypothetical protein